MLAGPVETACRTANKMHAFGDKRDARERRVRPAFVRARVSCDPGERVGPCVRHR